MKKVNITPGQRAELERLWFIYGNMGKKHTHAGHRFIQVILEDGEDCRDFFKPNSDVLQEVDKVLNTSTPPTRQEIRRE